MDWNQKPYHSLDSVSYTHLHHFCGAKDINQGLVNEEAFERNIEGHRRARRIFDPDVAKVMNDTLMLVPIDCSHVETARDLSKIDPPAMDSMFVKKTVELTKRVRAIYEDSDIPVYGTSFSPYTVPVSYTHLDVYKRQRYSGSALVGTNQGFSPMPV